jgi:formaldehyde-activating enzyme involved in methanogenesis
MTTPRERTLAIQQLQAITLSILDETKAESEDDERVYAHVSMSLLKILKAALTHYPSAKDLLMAHKCASEVFGAPV